MLREIGNTLSSVRTGIASIGQRKHVLWVITYLDSFKRIVYLPFKYDMESVHLLEDS